MPFDPISIVGFLINFKLACDTIGVQEGVAMWLFYIFMKKTASAVSNARIKAEATDKNAAGRLVVRYDTLTFTNKK